MIVETELSFEDMVSEMERLVGGVQSLDLDLEELKEKMVHYEVNTASFDGLISQIKTSGASREIAMAMEQCVEGVLPARYPVQSFTAIPSKTNLKVALEAASSGKIALIGTVVAAIIAAIVKIIMWAIQLVRSTKGAGQASMKEAAQARTASETTNDIVKGARQTGKMTIKNFDANEILKLRREVFIDPAKQQISKMLLILVFQPRASLRTLYETVCGDLFGTSNSFEMVERAILNTKDKIDNFLKKSEADESTVDMELIRLYEQPLRSVIYAFATAGMLTPEHDFQGQRWSKVKQSFTPVTQTQYIYCISQMAQLLTSPSAKKACEDIEASAIMDRNQYFDPEFYNSTSNLDKLEKEVQWFGTNIAFPDDADVRLSKLDSAINELKKSYDALEKAGKRDANAAQVAAGMLQHINSYQQDIHFLSRMVFSVRFLQRDLAGFFRLMTNGETACINYLKALLDPKSETAFRNMIADHKKDHVKTLARFKGYAE